MRSSMLIRKFVETLGSASSSARGNRRIALNGVLGSIATIATCFSLAARAQNAEWQFVDNGSIRCTTTKSSIAGANQSSHQCYMSVHLLERRSGELFTCVARAQVNFADGQSANRLTGGGDCRPLFTPSETLSVTARFNGAFAETASGISTLDPLEEQIFGGIAYWSAQSAKWETAVCVRMPSGQSDCFPVRYILTSFK